MPILDVAGAALFNMMRRRVANSTAPGTWPDHIQIEIVHDRRGYIVRATYSFRITEMPGGNIAFDLSESPLVLLECMPGNGFKNDVTMNRSVVWLTVSEHADSAQVVLDLLWPWSKKTAPTGLDFLLLPDFLPPLLRPEIFRTFPQPTLGISIENEQVQLTGFVRRRGDVGDGALLQLMIAREGALTENPDGPSIVSLSGGFAGTLSHGERQRVRTLLLRIYEWIEAYIGYDVACRFCIVTPAELEGVRFQPTGMCLVATPDAFGLGVADGEPADFALASIVAGVWWSAGCRFLGRNAKELQVALQNSTGLAWVEYIHGATGREEIARQLSKVHKTHFLHDWSLGVQGFVRPRVRARLNNMLAATGDAADVRARLQKLNSDYWGKNVPVSEAVRAIDHPLRPRP